MFDRDYHVRLLSAAAIEGKKHVTKESALRDLQQAGIVDEEGYLTEPYRKLEWFFNRKARPVAGAV